MSILNYIGSTYLQRQPQINNGGVAAFILNNIAFENGSFNINNITNIKLWRDYANGVFMNSTRYEPFRGNQSYQINNLIPVDNPIRNGSILMILWLVTFLVLMSLLYATSELQRAKDRKDKRKMKDLVFLLPRAIRRNMCKTRMRRAIVIFSITSVLIMWTVFICLLCTTQYVISSKLRNNPPNQSSASQYDSINDVVVISFEYLNSFFDVITNKTGVFLGNSMTNLNMNIKKQLNASIIEFGDEIFVKFNITYTFETAKIVLNVLGQVISGMTFIKDNSQNIISTINNVNVTVDTYKRDIDICLYNICSLQNLSQILQNQCQILKTKNQLLKTDINTPLIDSSSSDIAISIIREYSINITDITQNFYKIDNSLKSELDSMLNSSISSFNISSYLSSVPNVWSQLVSVLSPGINATKAYNAVLNIALDSTSKYENLVTIVMIFLIFISILLLLLFSFRESLQDKSLNQVINFGIQFFFIFVMIISCLFCIVVLMFTNFARSEVCNQINTTSGIRVLDQIVNDKITDPWNAAIQPMLTSYTNINISMSQPVNIISGIKDRCRNTSLGLFAALGMGNFINVTKIVRSESVMSFVQQAENESLKAFLRIKPDQIIPKDLKNFINKTIDLVQYFDGINYNTSLRELRKPLVGIVDFAGYFSDLSLFALRSSNSVGWTDDLIHLNNTANKLLSMTSNWTFTQNNVNNLANNFQTLQDHRNNSLLMGKLVTVINGLSSLFNDTTQIIHMFSSLYNRAITINLLNTVDQIINGSFSVITYQMIPCMDLSLIFEAVTTTVCSNIGFNAALASFGLILLAETMLCQIISILVMLSTSLRMNYEENVSKC